MPITPKKSWRDWQKVHYISGCNNGIYNIGTTAVFLGCTFWQRPFDPIVESCSSNKKNPSVFKYSAQEIDISQSLMHYDNTFVFYPSSNPNSFHDEHLWYRPQDSIKWNQLSNTDATRWRPSLLVTWSYFAALSGLSKTLEVWMVGLEVSEHCIEENGVRQTLVVDDRHHWLPRWNPSVVIGDVWGRAAKQDLAPILSCLIENRPVCEGNPWLAWLGAPTWLCEF